MTKKDVLGFKPIMRLEHVGDKHTDCINDGKCPHYEPETKADPKIVQFLVTITDCCACRW